MSITFAVSTYSGGLPRIDSIRTRPSFRSFFSLARRTRTSFARFSASMRWSRDRRGAWVAVFVDIGAGRPILPNCPPRSSDGVRAESGELGCEARVVHLDNSELVADPFRRVGVCEEHGSERNVARTTRDEVHDVLCAHDAAHPDDG